MKDSLAGLAPERMPSHRNSHLKQLESEAICVMREVAAQFERPVLLFSGGKDSIVMVHLARNAFWPGRFPFPLLHVDTGHNFPETIEVRDRLAQAVGRGSCSGRAVPSHLPSEPCNRIHPRHRGTSIATEILGRTRRGTECAGLDTAVRFRPGPRRLLEHRSGEVS